MVDIRGDLETVVARYARLSPRVILYLTPERFGGGVDYVMGCRHNNRAYRSRCERGAVVITLLQ